ncbi:MAG TPA: AraC family transcriptional regulator [Rhizomicrobium sp.]|jgi:AraC-like DNA-binding protein|nr:AraC family transcriptional regulator [Rhizomicrobium sp.]
MNCHPAFAETRLGPKHHGCCEHLARHCHREPFIAVLLTGAYIEAGDRGRVRVGPGDVVFHDAYESHLDLIGRGGAVVLVLPGAGTETHGSGYVDDADFIARIAERDPREAAQHVMTNLRPVRRCLSDWPDRLAADLQADPSLVIRHWADAEGLRHESISRGFRRAYGITPLAFRARARALKALARLASRESLACVAAACGFADQAHMSRSIRALTGRTPREFASAPVGASRGLV